MLRPLGATGLVLGHAGPAPRMLNDLEAAMSTLRIHQAAQPSAPPFLEASDPDQIQQELAERGIDFQRWPTSQSLPTGANQEVILQAYANEVARMQASGAYPTVDAIRITPDHPDKTSLREKFLREHTHSEDEVRLFVEGRGLFTLHIGEEVLQLLCEADDWIAVPAGTKHWFDMGSEPNFCAIRFFNQAEGWVAEFTGDTLAEHFDRLE
jgi:1,2-dihydroxy-3-keto-5-methylthiopentene dioxygenase